VNYNEIQPNSELRAYARGQLSGVWGKMVFAYFVLFLIYIPQYFFSILNSIMESDESSLIYLQNLVYDNIPVIADFTPGISNVLTIIMLLTTGPFALGFAGLFLKRIRGEEIATKNIFDGFKRFFPSFLVMFFTTLFTSLWSILLVIPGIVKALAYSMAFNIMYDNPEIKPLEAIKRSQIMMKGYKGKLFLLELSFIGWAFLCVLSLGIGYLWLNPYMNLSIANFYENLKRRQENNQAANQVTNQAKPPIDLFQAT